MVGVILDGGGVIVDGGSPAASLVTGGVTVDGGSPLESIATGCVSAEGASVVPLSVWLFDVGSFVIPEGIPEAAVPDTYSTSLPSVKRN